MARRITGAVLILAGAYCIVLGIGAAWMFSGGMGFHEYQFGEHIARFWQELFGDFWSVYWKFPAVGLPVVVCGCLLFRKKKGTGKGEPNKALESNAG